MLHAGLDLSRKRVDVCLLSAQGEQLAQLAVPPDADALRSPASRIEESGRNREVASSAASRTTDKRSSSWCIRAWSGCQAPPSKLSAGCGAHPASPRPNLHREPGALRLPG
jgi:hypothetical protein